MVQPFRRKTAHFHHGKEGKEFRFLCNLQTDSEFAARAIYEVKAGRGQQADGEIDIFGARKAQSRNESEHLCQNSSFPNNAEQILLQTL